MILDASAIDSLTPREREVLRLAATGSSARQSGARLGITPRTVEVHLHNARTKLGVSKTIVAVLALHQAESRRERC